MCGTMVHMHARPLASLYSLISLHSYTYRFFLGNFCCKSLGDYLKSNQLWTSTLAYSLLPA